jgi:hypothetical protein
MQNPGSNAGVFVLGATDDPWFFQAQLCVGQ